MSSTSTGSLHLMDRSEAPVKNETLYGNVLTFADIPCLDDYGSVEPKFSKSLYVNYFRT